MPTRLVKIENYKRYAHFKFKGMSSPLFINHEFLQIIPFLRGFRTLHVDL
jgi:hypothetical protein